MEGNGKKNEGERGEGIIEEQQKQSRENEREKLLMLKRDK